MKKYYKHVGQKVVQLYEFIWLSLAKNKICISNSILMLIFRNFVLMNCFCPINNDSWAISWCA